MKRFGRQNKIKKNTSVYLWGLFFVC